MIRFYDVTKTVADEFGVGVLNLIGNDKSRKHSTPRQICYSILRDLTDSTYREIGKYYGGRDHSTVLHGIVVTAKRLRRDKDLSQKYRRIASALGASEGAPMTDDMTRQTQECIALRQRGQTYEQMLANGYAAKAALTAFGRDPDSLCPYKGAPAAGEGARD